MSSGAVAKLAKPVLRGHLIKNIKFHLAAATALSFVTAACYYQFISAPRKKRYEEFYKTYDPDKDYERMKATGNVFKNI